MKQIFFFLLATFSFVLFVFSPKTFSSTYRVEDGKIEIIENRRQTIIEYWKNGSLAMVKIIPKKGRSYYLVPAPDIAETGEITHESKLYPRWVILEF